MNTRVPGNSWLTLCWFAVLALFPYPVPADETTKTPQVLIAAESSAFKDRVVTRVTNTLRDDGFAVTIIPLSELPKIRHEPYRAIVVVNTCRAWRPSSELRDLVKNADTTERRRLVVVTTAAGGECDPGAPDVDAISSASKRTRADAIADQTLERVRARLIGR